MDDPSAEAVHAGLPVRELRICLNGCLAPGTLSEEILSRFFLAGGEGCAGRVCRKVCRGYVGRYVGRYVRRGLSRVRRKGMSEGMSERWFNGMSDKYVGRVCRKACREGMSESGSGCAASAPPQVAHQGDIKSGTRYIYIYI